MKKLMQMLALLAGLVTFNVYGACPSHFTAGDRFYIAKLNLLIDCVTASGISPLTTKGDVWGYSSSNARIPIGTDGQVLTADSGQTLGLKWSTPGSGALTTKGDVLGYSSVAARIPVGTDGQVLTADSGQTLGLKWATPSSAGTLNSTQIGVGDGSNLLSGSSALTYGASSGVGITNTQTYTGSMLQKFINSSNGTSATSEIWMLNDTSGVASFGKRSSGFTTTGLKTADQSFLSVNGGTFLFSNADSSDFIFARGGTAAGNEVMRLGAGTLTLGVAGTTTGTLALSGSTSGTATLTASSTAATITANKSFTSTATVSDALGDVRLIPQNSQSTAYTFAASDCGKHVLHPSADTTARTFTIDSNTNLALSIGCAITIVNQNAAGIVTLAITSDVMRLAGPGTTGSRTIAANCVVTVLKIVSTEWIVTGGSCLT